MRTSATLLPFAAVALVSVVAAHEVDHQHQARHLQLAATANNGLRLEKLVRRQSLVDSALSIADPTADTAASSAEDNDSGGSGINKPTLIVIIVVASSIALVAAIWTIIRKTAFSPSRRFEAKLAPIDLVTGRRDRDSFDGGADAILAHGRSGSVMSGQMSERYGPNAGYAASLGRSDSGKGSLRTTGGSIRGGREGAYPGSIPYNPQPTAYSGPAYYQQPYHGQQQHFGSAQPGYPSEQAFGYSNLQRGASSRTDLSRGGSARQPATPAGAYDYAAQQRQLAQSRSQSRGPY
ncbi:hypothetical protein BCR35DRAFT_68574 [Leucosporidium creatinivorum]|uniref:Uncharacterized protein n=1 Tax=Leucosporidium creatinivorum TaxID=106004 RepID=A0A1Y2G291_9BASI|nr:hypothetical protein BCR35DRAFT_68574 [Leucosporidium creatinivorum]